VLSEGCGARALHGDIPQVRLCLLRTLTPSCLIVWCCAQ